MKEGEDMTNGANYQSELRARLNEFHTQTGFPKKAVTLTITEQKLIVQYEPKGGIPDINKLLQIGKEMAITSGASGIIAGGVAMLIGRTLLGGVAARVGIAGAFGAIGLGVLAPAILVGCALGGIGYTVYKLGRNRVENEQAQAFGQELIEHLKDFQPESLLPTDLTIVTSSDRHITVIYDPELDVD